MANIIRVFSPEKCPFRYTALYYDADQDYCNLAQKEHIEIGDEICFCSDDRWIEGCPLLIDNFLISKR